MSPDTQMLPSNGGALIVVQDNSQFANFLDTGRYEQIKKVAMMLCRSQLVPDHFKNKPEDCFLAANMAMRVGIDPMLLMQNIYVVHGKPGMQAQLAIALVNSSGLFADPLDYEIEGDDPTEQNYRVRAFAKRKSTDKIVYGPWVDWKIVKAERWDGKDGSKWRTMPGLMFIYRAASWFARTSCPERLMGMQTVEEIEDVGPQIRRVDSIPIPDKAQAIADRFRKPELGAQQSQGVLKSPQEASSDDSLPAAYPPTAVSPAISNVSGGPGSNEPGPAPAVGEDAEKLAIIDEEGLTQEWPRALEYILLHYEGQLTLGAFKDGIAKWVLNLGKKGKEGAIKLMQRQALFNAIRDGSFNFGTGMIE